MRRNHDVSSFPGDKYGEGAIYIPMYTAGVIIFRPLLVMIREGGC